MEEGKLELETALEVELVWIAEVAEEFGEEELDVC